MTDKPTIKDCMEQAQVFASTWSLVGRGAFGSTIQEANTEKAALESMLRAALAAAAQAVPANPITAAIMRDVGGEHPVFCLMAAYRAEKDATGALAMLTGAPAQPAPAVPSDLPHAELRKSWKAGQRWQTRGDPAGQWLDTVPCWYADQEYRRHPDDSDAAAPAQAAPIEITDGMALAFHQAISDSSIGQDDADDIKTGLRAALANFTLCAQAAPVDADVQQDAERWRTARSLEHCNAIWCAIGDGEAAGNLDATVDKIIAARAAQGCA